MAKGDEASTLTLDLVIKLGGAAITDKATLETVRSDALQQGAALVKQCRDAGQRVAVVHGAGSFGHHQAKLYKVNEGLDKERGYHGFCLTRNSVSALNKLVVECLTDHGLPAVSCPAFPTWQTSGRAVSIWPREAIERVLQAGLVPVFHGDCVLDSKQDCCILSGDTIIKTLCNNFSVKRVMFLTDVQGFFDRPPHEEGANLLQLVHVTSDGQIADSVKTSSSSHDVTGGMLTKLCSAKEIVVSSSGRTRVFVAKLGSRDAEKLCLDQNINIKDFNATEVVLDTST